MIALFLHLVTPPPNRSMRRQMLDAPSRHVSPAVSPTGSPVPQQRRKLAISRRGNDLFDRSTLQQLTSIEVLCNNKE